MSYSDPSPYPPAGGAYPPSSSGAPSGAPAGGHGGGSGGADIAIYVGNLPFDVPEDEIRQMFAGYGEVTRVSLPTDRHVPFISAPRIFIYWLFFIEFHLDHLPAPCDLFFPHPFPLLAILTPS